MTNDTTTTVEATTSAGTTTEAVAPVTNLRDARREQSTLRKAAKPAGAEKPAAKKSATSPAKSAPVKKDAKSAPVINGTKLKWAKVDDSDAAVALTEDGSYSLLPHEGKWKVELRVGKKVIVLVSGVGRTAGYKVAVHHNKTGEVPAVKNSA